MSWPFPGSLRLSQTMVVTDYVPQPRLDRKVATEAGAWGSTALTQAAALAVRSGERQPGEGSPGRGTLPPPAPLFLSGLGARVFMPPARCPEEWAASCLARGKVWAAWPALLGVPLKQVVLSISEASARPVLGAVATPGEPA